ncbi:MAG: acyl-CoA dehydrogenase family protein [Alphaproteobacteria bacterium]|nr:acyl-CoA dehydrogenase family protein [Alphaproteobacteria bacterium]
MTAAFHFAPTVLPPDCERLRAEIGEFLAAERAAGSWSPHGGDFGSRHSPKFSRRLGARGWIGMTWPRRYGGGERSFLERYVVTEELLVAGAPVAAHWIADRQSGPLLLRFGTEAQRQRFLPGICRGEIFFCIGMSEPDSGSDLASIRTRAVPVAGGFELTGAKVWTSNAHRAHMMIALCRTSPVEGDRHQGLSQLLVDLKAPGITIRPIRNLAGAEDFNEVVFDRVFIPADMLVGELGAGWQQVTSELAFERSGPERFLSTIGLLFELVRRAGANPNPRAAETIGRLTAHLWTLRRMSLSVAGMLQAGKTPNLEAAIVKDLGNALEREIPELIRLVAPGRRGAGGNDRLEPLLAEAVLHAPSFTLRGGTREILRGIIARGLGLR